MLKGLQKWDEDFSTVYLVYIYLRGPSDTLTGKLMEVAARYLPLNLLLITKCTDQFVQSRELSID